MIHFYLQKALVEYESIGPLQFLNVIRICRGQAPIRNGVDGENHYAAVAARERNKIKEQLINDIEINPDEENLADLEEKEIEEIISLYK